MRRTFSLLFALVLLATLPGCASLPDFWEGLTVWHDLTHPTAKPHGQPRK